MGTFVFCSYLPSSFTLPWQSEILDRHGVRLNVLGRRELFPPNVQAAIAKAEKITRHNNACVRFFLSHVSLPWRV